MRACCKLINDYCADSELEFYLKYPDACRYCGGSGLQGFDDPCEQCEENSQTFVCALCATPLCDKTDDRICGCDYNTFCLPNRECVQCMVEEQEEAERMYQL